MPNEPDETVAGSKASVKAYRAHTPTQRQAYESAYRGTGIPAGARGRSAYAFRHARGAFAARRVQ
jgi:hypothetical protein